MGGTTSGSLDDSIVVQCDGVAVLERPMISLIVLTICSVVIIVSLAVGYAWCVTRAIGLH